MLVNTGDPKKNIAILLDELQSAFHEFMQGQRVKDAAPADYDRNQFGDAYAQGPMAQVTQTTREADVALQYSYLSHQIEINAKLAMTLQDRLEQYLRPDAPSTCGSESAAVASPVCQAGDRLRSLAEQVGSINGRLENTLVRLEAS